MKVCALALLFALWVAAVGSARAADPIPIRIGIANADNSAQPIYADELGLFASLGIAPQITSGMSGDDTLRGLQAGTLDVGFVNVVSIAGALQHGTDLVILAPGALYTSTAPITVLVQAAAASLHDGKDLNGKTIATPGVNDLGQLGVEEWVDRTGGDASSVHFVHGLSAAKIVAELADGSIDAAEINEPSWTVERNAGAVKLLANSFDAIAPTFLIGAYVTTAGWLRAHPAAAQRFADAMHRTALWANDHHAESAVIVAKRFAVPPAVAGSMVRAAYAQTLTPAILQPVLDAASKYGLLKPMPAAAMIEQSVR